MFVILKLKLSHKPFFFQETNGKGKDMDEAFKTKRDKYASFSDAKKANENKAAAKGNELKDAKSENEDDLELGEEASTISGKNDEKEEKKEVVVNDCLPNCLSTR